MGKNIKIISKGFAGMAPQSIIPAGNKAHILKHYAEQIKKGIVVIEDIEDGEEAPKGAKAALAQTLNVADTVALINDAKTAEEIDAIVGSDTRVGVLKAAEGAKAALA